MERFYPIGTPGQPWTDADKAAWLAQQTRKRSYREQVLDKLEPLRERFDVEQYGALAVDAARYPLFAVTCPAADPDAPWALVTGGVHGYETSGVQGALLFLAIAVASLWSSVILKWFALPVTTGEAFVLGQIMHLIRPDIIQVANVIGNPDTHSLILMTRCTTADALPHAAIGVAAVAYLLGDVRPERLRQALVMLAVIYVAANLVRLGGLAWSAESYALVHGPIGANAFDLFQAGLVLTLGNWAGSS